MDKKICLLFFLSIGYLLSTGCSSLKIDQEVTTSISSIRSTSDTGGVLMSVAIHPGTENYSNTNHVDRLSVIRVTIENVDTGVNKKLIYQKTPEVFTVNQRSFYQKTGLAGSVLFTELPIGTYHIKNISVFVEGQTTTAVPVAGSIIPISNDFELKLGAVNSSAFKDTFPIAPKTVNYVGSFTFTPRYRSDEVEATMKRRGGKSVKKSMDITILDGFYATISDHSERDVYIMKANFPDSKQLKYQEQVMQFKGDSQSIFVQRW